jgi:hypothetical protein
LLLWLPRILAANSIALAFILVLAVWCEFSFGVL